MQDAVEKERQAKGEVLAIHHRGENGNSSKLKNEYVLDIRARIADKSLTTSELAKKYSVSADTIRLIRRRKTWTHI